MEITKICHLIIFLAIFSNNSFAANRYWIGILGGNWNSSSNWSASSGGLLPASVPGINDVAIFDGGPFGARIGNCTINTDVSVAGITITSGYTGTISQGAFTIIVSGAAAFGGGIFTGGSADITIGGTFTLSATDFTSTSAIMELKGDAAFTGGTFAHNNGSVRFDGAAAQTISGTDAVTFYVLEFIGTGYIYTISATGNIAVVSSLTISGSSSCTLNSGTLNVSGNIVLTNTSTAGGGTSTINITGTANQSITSSLLINQSSLPAVTINKTGGTLSFPALITVCGNWTYTAGTMDVTTNNSTVVFARTLSISGSSHTLNNITFEGNNNWTFTVSTGTILTVTGTLTTTGSSNVVINDGTSGATAIQVQGDIIINNTSTTGGGQALILINGAGSQAFTSTAGSSQGLVPFIKIQKTSGILTLGGIISESRDWTYVSGTVAPSTSTVIFGGNNLSISSAGMSFYNAAVTANTSTLLNSLTANNNITISGTGVLAAGSNTINLSGNWSDWGAGGFTEGTSMVNFNGTALQTISSSGGENFTTLKINNSGTGIQFMNNITVSTGLTMTLGNGIATGIYFIRVQYGNKSETKKIIVGEQ